MNYLLSNIICQSLMALNVFMLIYSLIHFSSVQLLSRVRLFVTRWATAHQASLSITNSLSYSNSFHWVSDAIQPSHPLSCPSPPALNLSQHQPGSFPMSQLFASGGQSIGVSTSASVPPMNIQDWFPLGLAGLIFLLPKGLWRFFSNTTAPKHQFFSAQLCLWSNSHIHTWLLEKP